MAVVYCKKCCEPSSRPDSQFTEDGICLPCAYFAEFGKIDWESRQNELKEICDWGRANAKGAYDCIIGVSGGKDSHRQAFYVRDELGLKPLLVSVVYPPEQQTERGAVNLANLIEHGFDVHMIGPGPRTSKALMQYSFKKDCNLFKITELALYAAMPREAIAQGIPLMFLGENPALQYGGVNGSLSGDGNQQRKSHTLAGADIAPLVTDGFDRRNLFWYDYPSEADFDRGRLRIVYLGFYMHDFNEIMNTEFAIKKGLRVREGADADPAETGALNEAEALDDEFVHVNQFLKCLKFGFGKVTQQVSSRIRLGQFSREEAIEMVRRYDGKCSDRYVEKLCRYLKITEDEFWDLAEAYRNRDLWQLNNHGEWELRYKIS
jgi:N-acetyl sugar amidotransferase